MLLFEPPFLPDSEYTNLLHASLDRLHSLYFSLQAPGIPDGRHKLGHLPLASISRGLGQLPGPRKYALLNSRFHCPGDYFSPEALETVLGRLRQLHQASVLDGLVFADHYLLQALSDQDPALCATLEAVPSINLLLDSRQKVLGQLESIDRTAFKPPSLLLLDRSLNRSRSQLAKLTAELRRSLPGVSLGLLANEGCLQHCPFKLTHDAHIAFGSLGCGREMSSAANQDLGCGRTFREDPSQILRSPFIRPEDAGAYADLVDFLKLSGRTRGPQAMAKVLRHYLQGSYQGNLVELMDTQECLAPRFLVPNQSLPADFGRQTLDCELDCSACSYCRSLAERVIKPQPLPLKPMWA